MRFLLLSLALGVCPHGGLAAQEPLVAPVAASAVPGSYIVHFQTRSFDLEEFAAAIRGGASAERVAEIVAKMEAAVRVDQAPFAAAVERLGGRVVDQWWIINAASVAGIAGDGVARLGELAGVDRVEPVEYVHPDNNTARNAQHHNAVTANTRLNALNQAVTGTGVSVGIIDTGVDADYQGTGVPNRAYFPGGNTANTTGGGIGGSRLRAVFASSGQGTEDANSHGTHVSGSVASGDSAFRGLAPDAWIVGLKISGAGTSGSASTNSIVNAWQTVAAQRVALNLKVANNSFSGSPSLTSSVQMALDSAARNADVLACCSAGNAAADTTSSQNVWNGLACGSVNKTSLARSSFSGQGPLDNFGRTYPDIAGVGASVVSTAIDSTSGSTKSGTSMASPMIAGGAALVRHAVPAITALETKAVLLNTTKGTQTNRNDYGLGVMDCDAAVVSALAGKYFTVTMTPGNRVEHRAFAATTAGSFRITATWMHPPGATFDNVDMRVYNGTTLVASDLNTLNSYEHVDFVAAPGVVYDLELTWVGTAVASSLPVAIAGFSDVPPAPPVLTSVSPAQVVNGSRATITLTGSFDQVDRIDLGSLQITDFTAVSNSQITFALPLPAPIGAAVPISVHNFSGSSSASTLQIDGLHPASVGGLPFALRGTPTQFQMIGDANWNVWLFASLDLLPSSLPGVLDLGIGNGFTSLIDAGTYPLGASGYLQVPLTFPTTIPPGTYRFQGLHFDPASLTFPVEASNVFTIGVF